MIFCRDINPLYPTAKLEIWKEEVFRFGKATDYKYLFTSKFYPDKTIGFALSISETEMTMNPEILIWRNEQAFQSIFSLALKEWNGMKNFDYLGTKLLLLSFESLNFKAVEQTHISDICKNVFSNVFASSEILIKNNDN